MAFIFAVVLALAGAVALVARPDDQRLARAIAVLFGGLIAAYAASRTTGIPLLSSEPEAVDGVGVVTNVIEALGLLLALRLAQPLRRRDRRLIHPEVP